MSRLLATCFATLLGANLLFADVESGPKAGEELKDFKVFSVTGPVEGKEVSYLMELKEKPTVYLFIQQERWVRPMAKFMKVLDTECKDANKDVQIVAVWLSEKPDDVKEYLPKANTALSLDNTALTVFQGEKSGPNGWSINSDAHITVVVASKGKAAATFAFQSVNDTDVPKVKEALKKLTAK